MTEHSMCQPGRPRPHGESHDVSSPACSPSRARSRGVLLERVRLLLLDLVGPLASRPYPGSRATKVHVTFDRVRVLALDELLDEADDLGNHLARLGLVVGHPQAEAAGVLEVPRRHPLGELGARARAAS